MYLLLCLNSLSYNMGTFFRKTFLSVHVGYQTVSKLWNYGHHSQMIVHQNAPQNNKFLPVVPEIWVRTDEYTHKTNYSCTRFHTGDQYQWWIINILVNTVLTWATLIPETKRRLPFGWTACSLVKIRPTSEVRVTSTSCLKASCLQLKKILTQLI